jgi:hypothetical protein
MCPGSSAAQLSIEGAGVGSIADCPYKRRQSPLVRPPCQVNFFLEHTSSSRKPDRMLSRVGSRQIDSTER